MAPLSVVLYQHGDNMFGHRWLDSDGRLAFSVSEANRDTNLVLKLHRENAWAALHTTIMGPEKSWFYLGPNHTHGYICYGNNQDHFPMASFRKLKREGATSESRYFTAQSGKEYRWKISDTGRMECMDGWSTIAIYELSHPDEDFYGKITLKSGALPFCTEVMTSLVLNRMAKDLNWSD